MSESASRGVVSHGSDGEIKSEEHIEENHDDQHTGGTSNRPHHHTRASSTRVTISAPSSSSMLPSPSSSQSLPDVENNSTTNNPLQTHIQHPPTNVVRPSSSRITFVQQPSMIIPPYYTTSPSIAMTHGHSSTIIHRESGISISQFEEIRQIRPWISYFYTHCQIGLSSTSHEDLHDIYHRSYEEIKWYLLFIDLIFVSVVYNTEHFISKCGSDEIDVYVLAISMFSIVFLARHALDEYASMFIQVKHGLLPFLQNDLLHQILVILYGFGILSMAINIDAEPIPDHPTTDLDGLAYFGHCELRLEYTFSFAVGLILCKVITIIWFGAMLFVAGVPSRGGDLTVLSTHYAFALFNRIVHAIFVCLLMVPATTPYFAWSRYLFPILACLWFFDDVLRKFNFLQVQRILTQLVRYCFGKNCNKLCCSSSSTSSSATSSVKPASSPSLISISTFESIWKSPKLNFQIRVKERVAVKARQHSHSSTHSNSTKHHSNSNSVSAIRFLSTSSASSALEDHPEVFVDFATLVERVGIVFVLVLGEAIIGLSFANYNTKRSNSSRLTEFSSYVLIAAYATQFFETLDVTTPDLHCLRGGVYLATFFYFLNILASFDLLVAVAGLLQLYDHAISGDIISSGGEGSSGGNGNNQVISTVDQASWQLSFGLFLTQIILILLRFSHKLHLRRSVRRGLTVMQKLKVLYQLNLLNRLSSYEIASLVSFFISAILHLAIYPLCREEKCSADGVISGHAIVAAVFSGVYLFLQAIDERKKEKEYVSFQERRRKTIRDIIRNTTTMREEQRNSLLLSIGEAPDLPEHHENGQDSHIL